MKLEVRRIALLFSILPLCMAFLTACGGEEQPPAPTPGPGAGFMPNEPFGITYVSHYGHWNQERRDLSIARQIGADWDRWPLPWNVAEPNADGLFEWEGVGDEDIDFVHGVNLDDGAGLKVIGLLNGPIPGAYQTPSGPDYFIEGLGQAVFLDTGEVVSGHAI
jgi:hypothetical protein